MWIVPRWTAICSTVLASKSECSACQTISTIKPANWTASAAQINIRDFLRRDMPLPPPYDHRTGLCYLPRHERSREETPYGLRGHVHGRAAAVPARSARLARGHRAGLDAPDADLGRGQLPALSRAS